jgi:hypothetical protein
VEKTWFRGEDIWGSMPLGIGARSDSNIWGTFCVGRVCYSSPVLLMHVRPNMLACIQQKPSIGIIPIGLVGIGIAYGVTNTFGICWFE